MTLSVSPDFHQDEECPGGCDDGLVFRCRDPDACAKPDDGCDECMGFCDHCLARRRAAARAAVAARTEAAHG